MDIKKEFDTLDVIDSHLHMYHYKDLKTGEYFLHGLEEYKEMMHLRAFNIACLPSGSKRDVSDNIFAAFYKLANPTAYAHGGLTYAEYPPLKKDDGKDPLTQY